MHDNHNMSRFLSMSDHYIDKCTILVININNGIKEPTRGYRNCNTGLILESSGYVKVRKSLYTRVINWVNSHYDINTRIILSKCEGSNMVYEPEGCNNNNLLKYPHPTGIKNLGNPHYKYPNHIEKGRYESNTGSYHSNCFLTLEGQCKPHGLGIILGESCSKLLLHCTKWGF